MELIVWSDLFNTDIPLVDEQHHRLFDMINEIIQTLEKGDIQQEEVDKALDQLVAYAEKHFVDEEREMVHKGIDVRHQKFQRMEHSSFIYDLNKLRNYLDEGEFDEQYEKVLEFSASWLIYHTLKTDQKLAMQFHAIDSGKTPAEAFDYAETHPLSPAIYQKVVEAVIHLWRDALERISDLEERLKEHE